MKEAKKYVVIKDHFTKGDVELEPMTVEELTGYFSYTLEVGRSWQHEKSNKKIDCHPSTIKSLLKNLNNAKTNAAANGYSSEFFYLKGEKNV